MRGKNLVIDSFLYENKDNYNLCRACKDNIVPNLRCFTWGGAFDREVESPFLLEHSINVMLIGQNPWFNKKKYKENIYERAFGDKSEKILIEYFSKYELDISRLWITNIVKCSVTDNNPNNVEKAFSNCKHFIVEEIEKVNPKILVPMGTVTFDLLLDLIHEFKLDQKVYKIYHPNAISYNPKLKEKFELQILKLKELINEVDRVSASTIKS